jgi:choline-sulfatase
MGFRSLSGTVRAAATAGWMLMLCFSASCGARDARDGRRDAPDVVLVTIDTLRADRVGVDGGPQGVTPALDALGRAGVVFLDATAHAPLTLPSHASILTGRYPVSHGVHDNSGFALADSTPTLADALHGAGYHTAAFVSSYVLRRATGLARGFDVYDDRFEGIGRTHLTTTTLERKAAETAREAAAWMRNAPHPFFLWVHFYDPHAPYDAPPAFAARFPGRPYDAEVAAADFGVSTLLAAIAPDRRAATLVVATGDHGESLGEHGESEHGLLLYDATLHVPLIVQGAGLAEGVRVTRQVRHVDLVPTIAELAGVRIPGSVDGVSLAPLLRARGQTGVRLGSDPAAAAGDASGAPASYAESRFGELHFGWSPIHSLRDGTWKYIDGPDPELFRLSDDRAERANRRSARPDTASGMATVLRDLTARAQAAPGTETARTDAAERLRALGYVSGRVELGGAGGSRGDPKREIARYEAYVAAFNGGIAALDMGRAGDAESAFRRLAREFPRAFEPHQYLARALAARHATADAVAEFDAAISLSPREPVLYFDAARALADGGQFDRAFARVAEGRRLDPSSFYGALAEGLVARAAGDVDRAERAFRDAVQMNPTLAVAHLELGRIAEARGDRGQARREYQLALDGDATLDAARRALDHVNR